jgi:hypothetical protein
MDRDEERYAADPANPGTDGDTLLDGKEIRVYGTFPFSWDTDSDCLGDYREVKEDGTKRDGVSRPIPQPSVRPGTTPRVG